MATEAKRHFCYRLSLREDLRDFKNWTEEENQTVGVHFNYLKGMLEAGKLVLAGRTINMPMTDKDMGIAILETNTMEEAAEIMANDPAVKSRIMSAELFEFSLALYR